MKEKISTGIISISVFMVFFYLYVPLKSVGENYIELRLKRGEGLLTFFEKIEKKTKSIDSKILLFFNFLYNPYFKPLYAIYKIPLTKNFIKIIKSINSPYLVSSSVKITIPEGLKLRKILKIISKHTGIEEEELKKIAFNKDKFKKFFPKGSKIPDNLEGYIYPETYIISLNAQPSEILGIMIEKMFQTIKELGYDTLKHKFELNLHQILTLASIVEKEALFDDEKRIIASVFYNRLKKNMPLQADPTIQYLLEKPIFPLPYKFLNIRSPYNTYINKGLPPGPICSPDRESIKAVLYPAKTEYLYFVAKADGRHIFSKTYKEHIKNKRIAKKTWRKRKLF